MALIYHKEKYNLQRAVPVEEAKIRKINFNDIQIIFFLFGAALCLGGLTFSYERFNNRKQKVDRIV